MIHCSCLSFAHHWQAFPCIHICQLANESAVQLQNNNYLLCYPPHAFPDNLGARTYHQHHICVELFCVTDMLYPGSIFSGRYQEGTTGLEWRTSHVLLFIVPPFLISDSGDETPLIARWELRIWRVGSCSTRDSEREEGTRFPTSQGDV